MTERDDAAWLEGMARKLRVEYAGACDHVLNRGNCRRDLFNGKGAAESFQRCLLEAAQRFGWRMHAFVIMRNHFHLALETPEPNLSEGMRWLQATWAARFVNSQPMTYLSPLFKPWNEKRKRASRTKRHRQRPGDPLPIVSELRR